MPIKILTTRPEAMAERLVLPLQAAGYQVNNVPLLAIEPLTLQAQQKQWLMDLDLFQRVVVISPSAADVLLETLEDFWPQWPVGVNWYTVGQGTKLRLAQAGIEAVCPEQGDKSEDLLLHPELQQLAGEKVLLAKGLGGRDLLYDSLTARGAKVSVLPLYERVKPKLNPQQVEQLLAGSHQVLVVTSGESLLQYLAFMQMKFKNRQTLEEQLNRCWLLVPSYRIEKQARQMGFNTIVNTKGAGADAILVAIKALQ
ncbi:MAG TPA: uroporphyrinogen-III synthase [Marinospirillum sp.]|uniref:uroporphyrinogen-III synthase n=1 Tax=Marinospirillum sp. TaxID=2183934 RepID=UPI002B45F2AE|nr:uroporphyrinogen-III synthase [Marinospirillum sp.]HKM14578.1 uroporphyrinogen-III synthase [Marinospirillum sp.]